MFCRSLHLSGAVETVLRKLRGQTKKVQFFHVLTSDSLSLKNKGLKKMGLKRNKCLRLWDPYKIYSSVLASQIVWKSVKKSSNPRHVEVVGRLRGLASDLEDRLSRRSRTRRRSPWSENPSKQSADRFST